MEKEEKNKIYIDNSIADMEADMRKFRLVSDIMIKGELGDEEENKGRS
jgi:hypothetical protein